MPDNGPAAPPSSSPARVRSDSRGVSPSNLRSPYGLLASGSHQPSPPSEPPPAGAFVGSRTRTPTRGNGHHVSDTAPKTAPWGPEPRRPASTPSPLRTNRGLSPAKGPSAPQQVRGYAAAPGLFIQSRHAATSANTKRASSLPSPYASKGGSGSTNPGRPRPNAGTPPTRAHRPSLTPTSSQQLGLSKAFSAQPPRGELQQAAPLDLMPRPRTSSSFRAHRYSLTKGGSNKPASILTSTPPSVTPKSILLAGRGEVSLLSSSTVSTAPGGSSVLRPSSRTTPSSLNSLGQSEVADSDPGSMDGAVRRVLQQTTARSAHSASALMASPTHPAPAVANLQFRVQYSSSQGAIPQAPPLDHQDSAGPSLAPHSPQHTGEDWQFTDMHVVRGLNRPRKYCSDSGICAAGSDDLAITSCEASDLSHTPSNRSQGAPAPTPSTLDAGVTSNRRYSPAPSMLSESMASSKRLVELATSKRRELSATTTLHHLTPAPGSSFTMDSSENLSHLCPSGCSILTASDLPLSQGHEPGSVTATPTDSGSAAPAEPTPTHRAYSAEHTYRGAHRLSISQTGEAHSKGRAASNDATQLFHHLALRSPQDSQLPPRAAFVATPAAPIAQGPVTQMLTAGAPTQPTTSLSKLNPTTAASVVPLRKLTDLASHSSSPKTCLVDLVATGQIVKNPIVRPPSTWSSQQSTAQDTSGAGPPDEETNNTYLPGYSLSRVVGEGGFCQVKLGVHYVSRRKVAVKIIDKAKLSDPNEQKRVYREIKVLKRLRHECVIKIFEVIDTPLSTFLVMEYAPNGSLLDYVRARKRLHETEACYFFQQVVAGLSYCHGREVVHRDVKLENILLDGNNGLKIIDFGLSALFQPGKRLRVHCGSPSYAAPEIVSKDYYEGPPVDVWSLGVVLFAMVCGYLPFHSSSGNKQELCQKIISGQYTAPDWLSSSARDLLSQMLTVDPNKRISFADVWSHPWVSQGPAWSPSHTSVYLTKTDLVTGDVVADDEVLAQLEEEGYSRGSILKYLSTHECNSITASYYLLLEAKMDAIQHSPGGSHIPGGRLKGGSGSGAGDKGGGGSTRGALGIGEDDRPTHIVKEGSSQPPSSYSSRRSSNGSGGSAPGGGSREEANYRYGRGTPVQAMTVKVS